MEKSFGVQLELKDLDTSKGTAVIMHSVYNSIDRENDIAHKGMFTKSWNEGLPKIYINHEAKSVPGKTLRTFEDDKGAYTEMKFGNWTLGRDALEMASEGVFTGASFGYITQKKDYSTVKGKRVRNLREVKHDETSLLTVLACHPEAGIVTVHKALDAMVAELKMLSDGEITTLKAVLSNDMANLQSLLTLAASLDTSSDLYGGIMYMISRRADWTASIMDQLRWNAREMANMKSQVSAIEKYTHKAKASDENIIRPQNSIEEYKQIISDYDTATTDGANQPGASDEESIKQFLNSLNIATWTKQSLSN